MKHNTYERETLYEEIWEKPMTTVARKYGISSVMLKKICKKMNIPTPPRGYWAKVAAGQKPRKHKLPSRTKVTQVHGRGQESTKPANHALDSQLNELKEDESALLIEIANNAEYKERIPLRPVLADLKTGLDFPDRIRRVNHPQYYSFGEVISRKSSRCALAAVECLARLVESAGGRLSEPFKFTLLGEVVKLEIAEETRQVQHEITRKEAKELEEYKNSSWHKPNIRKWDYEFTGVLKFKVDAGYDFPLQESLTAINRGLSQKSIPDLSDLLSKVFLVMCKVCIAMRKERIDIEASLEDRERSIERQRQQIELYNDEVDRLFEIKEEAARYQEAQTLRDYAAAIEKTGDEGSQEKAEWIKRKADWMDPLKAAHDQVLGRLEIDKYPPEKKPLPSMRLPYEIDWFFRRRGRHQDSSWDDFIRLIEAKA